MNLHGWEYADLETDMGKSSLFELLAMYKAVRDLFSSKCLEQVKYEENLSELGKKNLETECEFLDGSLMRIAMEIADRMIKKETT